MTGRPLYVREQPDVHEHFYEVNDDGDMCPNCVTPWKCNGPHEGPRRGYRSECSCGAIEPPRTTPVEIVDAPWLLREAEAEIANLRATNELLAGHIDVIARLHEVEAALQATVDAVTALGNKAKAAEAEREAIAVVVAELRRAQSKFGPMVSEREGMDVISEEHHEMQLAMWYGVDARGRHSDPHDEAIQLGAMAIRFLIDVPRRQP